MNETRLEFVDLFFLPFALAPTAKWIETLNEEEEEESEVLVQFSLLLNSAFYKRVFFFLVQFLEEKSSPAKGQQRNYANEL